MKKLHLMKKIIIIAWLIMLNNILNAQETIYPVQQQNQLTFIINGTIHIGNGTIIENGIIKINKGKIEEVGKNIAIPADDVQTYDAKGKHIYPGLILPMSTLGLQEIGGIRSMQDFNELGEWNSNIRSISAYNADSKIINTLRSNGILLAHTAPQGSLIGGLSTIVQLDAWNEEDAGYKKDIGMNFYMPSLISRPIGRGYGMGNQSNEAGKEALEKIEQVKAFFREAKAYTINNYGKKNIKLEATKTLFNKQAKLYIHCDQVKQMLIAIDFVKEFNFNVVIVGGSESWQIADLLKQNNIAVILGQLHELPEVEDDNIDQPYKLPSILQKAGVLFCINDDDSQNRGRNLSYNAGTAVAYGLGKEEALSTITLNTAKILGIEDRTGSIETGKDANIIIADNDVLDMRNSIISKAWIQGRDINLKDKHKQLYERYKYKYGIK